MLSYYINQDNLADQKNSQKSKLKDCMKSEDKWEFRENIQQIFVLMKEKENQAAIAVVEIAHAVDTGKQMQN